MFTVNSVIELWARSNWANTYDGRNMILALSGYTAYFDASKNKGLDMMVAGYVASVEEWSQFEMGWKLTLAKYNVPYFHMKEFAHSQKAYNHPKWKSLSYRKSFMSDLIQIINGWTVASVCCAMKQNLFDKYNAAYELDKSFNAYAICGRDCAAQVRRFIRTEYKSDLPIGYIFDQGDEGRGFLMAEMEASKLPLPSFKRSRPSNDSREEKDDPHHVHLQACDLAAWELRRGGMDMELGKRGRQLRTSLNALAATRRRIWKETKERDLKGLIEVAGIPERLTT